MDISDVDDPYAAFAAPVSEFLPGHLDPILFRSPRYFLFDYAPPMYKYMCPFCKVNKWNDPKTRNEHAIRCAKNWNAQNNKKFEYDYRQHPHPDSPTASSSVLSRERWFELFHLTCRRLDLNSDGEYQDEMLETAYLKQQMSMVNIPTISWLLERVITDHSVPNASNAAGDEPMQITPSQEIAAKHGENYSCAEIIENDSASKISEVEDGSRTGEIETSPEISENASVSSDTSDKENGAEISQNDVVEVDVDASEISEIENGIEIDSGSDTIEIDNGVDGSDDDQANEDEVVPKSDHAMSEIHNAVQLANAENERDNESDTCFPVRSSESESSSANISPSQYDNEEEEGTQTVQSEDNQESQSNSSEESSVIVGDTDSPNPNFWILPSSSSSDSDSSSTRTRTADNLEIEIELPRGLELLERASTSDDEAVSQSSDGTEELNPLSSQHAENDNQSAAAAGGELNDTGSGSESEDNIPLTPVPVPGRARIRIVVPQFVLGGEDDIEMDNSDEAEVDVVPVIDESLEFLIDPTLPDGDEEADENSVISVVCDDQQCDPNDTEDQFNDNIEIELGQSVEVFYDTVPDENGDENYGNVHDDEDCNESSAIEVSVSVNSDGEEELVGLTVRHDNIPSVEVEARFAPVNEALEQETVETEDDIPQSLSNGEKSKSKKSDAEVHAAHSNSDTEEASSSSSDEYFSLSDSSASDADSEIVDVGQEIAQPRRDDNALVVQVNVPTEPEIEIEGPINEDELDLECAEVVIDESGSGLTEGDNAECLAQCRRDEDESESDEEDEDEEIDGETEPEIRVVSPRKIDQPVSGMSAFAAMNLFGNSSVTSPSESSSSSSSPSSSTSSASALASSSSSSRRAFSPESSVLMLEIIPPKFASPPEDKIPATVVNSDSSKKEGEEEEDDEVVFLEVVSSKRKTRSSLTQPPVITVIKSEPAGTDEPSPLPLPSNPELPVLHPVTPTPAAEIPIPHVNSMPSPRPRRYKREKDANGCEIRQVPVDQNVQSVVRSRVTRSSSSKSQSAAEVTYTKRYDVDLNKEIQIQLERITIPVRKPVVTPPSTVKITKFGSKSSPSTTQKTASAIKRTYSLRSEPGTTTTPKTTGASRTLRSRIRKKVRFEREPSPTRTKESEMSSSSSEDKDGSENSSETESENDEPPPEKKPKSNPNTPTKKQNSSPQPKPKSNKPEPSSPIQGKRKRGSFHPNPNKDCNFCKAKVTETRAETQPSKFFPSCCSSCLPKFGHLHVKIQSVYKQKQFRCGECSLILKSLPTALSHLKNHEKGKTFHLKSCAEYAVFGGPSTSKSKSADEPETPGKRDTQWPCKLCRKKFGTLQDLKSHMESHNLDKESEDESSPGNSDEQDSDDESRVFLKCKVKGCGKKYGNRQQLNAHMNAHALNKIFKKSR